MTINQGDEFDGKPQTIDAHAVYAANELPTAAGKNGRKQASTDADAKTNTEAELRNAYPRDADAAL